MSKDPPEFLWQGNLLHENVKGVPLVDALGILCTLKSVAVLPVRASELPLLRLALPQKKEQPQKPPQAPPKKEPPQEQPQAPSTRKLPQTRSQAQPKRKLSPKQLQKHAP